MQRPEKEDKMGRAPVSKLMLFMGVPMIVSMMLQALYNIVDSAFVSNMAQNGEAALDALTLAFPLQMLMVAVGVGTGVGANALAARCLGNADHERASLTAGNAQFLCLVIYVCFVLFGLFGVRPYIASQTTNLEICGMAVDYLSICCLASLGLILFASYEKLLQASGHSVHSTVAQVAGAVTNIVLDPVMIYGLLGCPEFGVRGAAYATVIGQWVSGLLGLLFHLQVNRRVMSHSLRYYKPNGTIIRGIYAIGLPAMIAQALMSVMTYGLNIILVAVGESLVTAYGLYYKIQQFILFAAFGLRDAITPIVAFANGMGNKPRIREGIKYGQLYTFAIMLAGTAAVELFAVPFAHVFGLNGETEALCVSAMRIISVSFVFAGANLAMQGVFQALDGGVESLIVSLSRQIVFVLPTAWLFAQTVLRTRTSPSLIWLTFIISEAATAAVSAALLARTGKKTGIWELRTKKAG